MKGYAGKMLRVNLSTNEIVSEPLDEQMARDFLGGRGFGIKHLYDELKPKIDPLGEDNKLIMCTGVLSGTSVQAANRWLCIAKSPLIGGYSKSAAGGDFGAWMKYAGYDYLIFEGIAEKPVYLLITEDGCELKSAASLWGKDTVVTQEWLEERHGGNGIKLRTACIGPAGENLVNYAAIVTGRRTASRTGIGTIMGSKKLKAVCIQAKRKLDVYDPDLLNQLIKDQVKYILANPDYQAHKDYGTTDGVAVRCQRAIFPVRNFRYGDMPGYQELSGDKYKELRVGDDGCYICGARCGKIHTVKKGPYAGAHNEGPEYESLWAFSGTIESNDISATIYADQLCDDYGLDTISTGVTIGCAYELYEKGLITKADTDGLELVYGNHAAMITLIKKIAYREGFGDLLAEGSLKMTQKLGKECEHYAMHVKGVELAGYEPRSLKATAFGYATSTIGGAHGNGSLAFQEWGMPVPRAVDRHTEHDKADIVIFNQNGSAANEIGVLCSFASGWGAWKHLFYNKMLAAVTGFEELADPRYVSQVGERIVNLERAFLVREGINREYDTLPKRIQTEPLLTYEGDGAGEMVRTLDHVLDQYYDLRGWTPNGIPSAQKLESLGLGYAVNDMPY